MPLPLISASTTTHMEMSSADVFIHHPFLHRALLEWNAICAQVCVRADCCECVQLS